MRLLPLQRFGHRSFIQSQTVQGVKLLCPAIRLFGNAPKPTGTEPAPATDRVWELWSEGNLFALSIAELTAFLKAQKVPHIDPTWRKSTLVKQVEEIVSSMRSLSGKSVKGDEIVRKTADELAVQNDALSTEGVFDSASAFVDVQQAGLYSGSESMGPIIPRAFQLMHESLSPDVLLSRINTSSFPGGSSQLQAYTFLPTVAANSNRQRFAKALQWCVLNLWNMSMDGEIHISMGRMLFWKGSNCYPQRTPEDNKRFMTLWCAQQQLQAHQPYTWLSIATPENEAAVTEFLETNGYTREDPSADAVDSYRITLKRQNREILEGEVSSELKTTSLKPSWERFLLSFYIRDAMPDVRVQLRARLPLKKKTADMFSGVSLLKKGADKVLPSIPGDLGEILLVSKRKVKTWKRNISSLRVTLIISEITSSVEFVSNPKNATDEVRKEYEIRCMVPQQSDTIDLAAISEEIWETVLNFSKTLEKGMEVFECKPITTNA